jgi:hypothetical protein
MGRLKTLALIALGLAALAACGGGSADGPTHEGWVKQADAICHGDRVATATLAARLEALAHTGIVSHRERAAAAAVIRRGLPYVKRELADLRRLRSPPADSPSAAALTQGLQLRIWIAEELAEVFEGGSAVAINRVLLRLVRNEEGAMRLARRAGLDACVPVRERTEPSDGKA